MNGAHEVVHEGRVMRHEMTTRASPSQVWSAWTEPARVSEWLTDRAEGGVGAGLTYTWIWDWCDMTVPYRVAGAETDRHLVLESDTRNAPGPVLEITISMRGGRTVVNLVASGFGETADWDAEYEGTNAGWHAMLAVLQNYVEHHYGEPRSTFTAMRPAQFDSDRVVGEWFTGEGLSRWLVERGGVGEEGSSFALTLRDGGSFTGRVLAVASREVQLAWDEIGGVVGLMVMPGASGQGTLCINGGGWRLPAEAAAEVEAKLERSLDRLVGQMGSA